MRTPRLPALLLATTLLIGARSAEAGLASPPVSGPAEEAPAEPRTTTILSQVSQRWFKTQWTSYRASFVSPEGRIVDNANGGVSHSEGQGYGLLLAVAADDPAGFEAIWRWTVDHLQIRPDGLFAWRWDPKHQGVSDRNDASDGDVLIAWALARAAKRFNRPDYGAAAGKIADAVMARAVIPGPSGAILLPGVEGFGTAQQPDGPVVNLSYWVFAAFRDLAPLSPGHDWGGLHRTGLKLLDASRFGPLGVPADWEGLGGPRPAPARNFPAQFGYDAVRIPLYLAWDPDVPPDVLARFARPADVGGPAVIDAATGSARQTMGGTGYRMIFALARCAARGETIPPDLMSTRDALYYPETLRLLSISVVQERLPQCL